MKTTIASRISIAKIQSLAKSVTPRQGMYRSLLEHVLLRGKAYTVTSSGSGKWTKNNDYTAGVQESLRELNIQYTTQNDAPRGGAKGWFVELNKVQSTELGQLIVAFSSIYLRSLSLDSARNERLAKEAQLAKIAENAKKDAINKAEFEALLPYFDSNSLKACYVKGDGTENGSNLANQQTQSNYINYFNSLAQKAGLSKITHLWTLVKMFKKL